MENQIDPGTGLPMTQEEIANLNSETVSEEVVADEAVNTASPAVLEEEATEAPVETPAEEVTSTE